MTQPSVLQTVEEIAEQIARDLFTNGQGERADRLVLTRHLGHGAYGDLGGWCESAVATGDQHYDPTRSGNLPEVLEQAVQGCRQPEA